ncbi:enoyl-CoA hydratase/isomerase family protein [Actinomadura flavalba]|uniref:enoyl-CoA hydratase/isomerase family protein n=1 Tax=Actinomadura flavalba TaxID=1120938 RepID=UPI00036C9E6F|nr:enoyl-CoA hydratase/isomerase family protein [Actinomadura flavalba]
MTLWTRADDDGVAVLTYRNPPRNFLTFAALAELDAVLAELAEAPDVRVVVLTSGVAGYFVAHADLDELAELSRGPVPRAKAWYTAMRRAETIPQPVIAAISGQAWGGGLELSLACTLRWAASDAHFSLPETALGIIPGAGGTQRLARLIGTGRAADLVLTGDVLTADRAHALGVVERVLPAEDFTAHVLRLARRIASRPAPALAAAKRALLDGTRLPVAEGLRLEAALFAETLSTPESAALQATARDRYARAADHERVTLDDLTPA